MALLGKGANMQSNAFFRACHFTRDLNLDVHGCTWPQTSDVKVLNNGHCYNGFWSPLLADWNFGYNKEPLKQIMLKHEAIFMDQIHELHRLYRRQRELMAETESNAHIRNNVQIKTTPSNFITWLRNEEVLESKCKKFGKKVLDLELPAREYVDCEEDLSLEDKKGPQSMENPFFHNNDLNSSPHGDVSAAASDETKNVADLNEPVTLDKVESLTQIESVVLKASSVCSSDLKPKKVEASSDSKARNFQRFGFHIDLNLCINEDELSPSSSNLSEIDLESPASPERNECSPLRGESDENQLKRPFSMSKSEDNEDGLVNIAAETIVSFSSLRFQTPSENTGTNQFQDPCDSLCWFAKIVCSLELLSNDMDYFEAMTLKLTETNVEDTGLLVMPEDVKKIP